eukprot:1175832-Prorocentrum_minimum.AAC.2
MPIRYPSSTAMASHSATSAFVSMAAGGASTSRCANRMPSAARCTRATASAGTPPSAPPSAPPSEGTRKLTVMAVGASCSTPSLW